jgi:hypothetical protein
VVDMTDANDQAEMEARRAYLVETFGPDVLVGLEAPAPDRVTRSANLHARDPLSAARRRRQAQDAELVQVAAKEQDEDQALALALRRVQHGNLDRIQPQTLAKAGRALRRRGYHQGSTAEQLARMAGHGEGWRPAS